LGPDEVKRGQGKRFFFDGKGRNDPPCASYGRPQLEAAQRYKEFDGIRLRRQGSLSESGQRRKEVNSSAKVEEKRPDKEEQKPRCLKKRNRRGKAFYQVPNTAARTVITKLSRIRGGRGATKHQQEKDEGKFQGRTEWF